MMSKDTKTAVELEIAQIHIYEEYEEDRGGGVKRGVCLSPDGDITLTNSYSDTLTIPADEAQWFAEALMEVGRLEGEYLAKVAAIMEGGA